VQAHGDYTLFTKVSDQNFTALLIYVDDIVLVGNSVAEFNSLKETLHVAFGIKNLGVLKYFLGLEAAHSSKGISLCQRQYCPKLLEDAHMQHCKPTRRLLGLTTVPTDQMRIFSMLCPHSHTSQEVTHPRIALGQARLIMEFLRVRLPKIKCISTCVHGLLLGSSSNHDVLGEALL
jgi:hypothetical protein